MPISEVPTTCSKWGGASLSEAELQDQKITKK